MGTESAQRLSLLNSLDGEWLKLPLAVMRDTGAAVQTLGGLLKITGRSRETYYSTAKIAERARLSAETVRKHLRALDAGRWIQKKGREKTRSGWLRRTATIALTKHTRDQIQPWTPLPWWACCSIKRRGQLTWGCKAVLSVLMGRLMALKATIDRGAGCGFDADDMEGAIEEMGGGERFAFSLRRLETDTGLSPKTIIAAKRALYQAGIVTWSEGGKGDHGEILTDVLVPNPAFRVIVTPSNPGQCYLRFES